MNICIHVCVCMNVQRVDMKLDLIIAPGELFLYIFIYILICICIYMYMYMYIYKYIYVHTCIYI
jgi:hypothetical protein